MENLIQLVSIKLVIKSPQIQTMLVINNLVTPPEIVKYYQKIEAINR